MWFWLIFIFFVLPALAIVTLASRKTRKPKAEDPPTRPSPGPPLRAKKS